MAAQSVQEEIIEMINHEDMEVQCEISPCCSEECEPEPSAAAKAEDSLPDSQPVSL